MTETGITPGELREMLVFAGGRVEMAEDELTSLDSAIGDGDHGITMRLGFQAVRKALTELPEETSIGVVMKTAGHTFMECTGGAIGVILGRMFITGGNSLTDAQQLGPHEFKAMMEAMETAVVKVGHARPGDKTLLDALHPAVASLAIAAPADSLVDLFSRAANAAEAGARGTATMPCSLGRASRLGDRALGHMDPGAVSLSVIIRAMSDWVHERDAQ